MKMGISSDSCGEPFLFKPPTEIGDYDDLLSDGALTIALFGHVGRIGVEVLTHRSLAQSFNRTWESEELVYHSPRVPRRPTKLCRMRHRRRSCARLCEQAGGELEQIQFLPGHASIQTTERYLGCKQNS
jgi:hypothetical protein